MNNERLVEIISNFRKVKMAVVGDLMLDDYIIGNVERISPEAPVPVVSVKEERFVLGGAGNVINNLATLGVKTFCYGVIGDDSEGDRLKKSLKLLGVNTEGLIRSEDRPTIVKRRILGGNQQLGAQIEHNEIDLLIFFRDPLAPKKHEPNVNDIVKLCDMYNIPMATNIATAEALVLALDRGDLDWREIYK